MRPARAILVESDAERGQALARLVFYPAWHAAGLDPVEALRQE